MAGWLKFRLTGRLAFVADFGKQNINLKTKFEMENKTSTNHEKGNDANRLLAAGLYCIKVQANHDCWIADWDGDPGRTLVKENAKTFKRKSDAEKLCNEMKVKYPNRNVWVDVF